MGQKTDNINTLISDVSQKCNEAEEILQQHEEFCKRIDIYDRMLEMISGYKELLEILSKAKKLIAFYKDEVVGKIRSATEPDTNKIKKKLYYLTQQNARLLESAKRGVQTEGYDVISYARVRDAIDKLICKYDVRYQTFTSWIKKKKDNPTKAERPTELFKED